MSNRIHKLQSSNSGDALLTTGYADDFTTRGNAFLIEKNITIGIGETVNILFDYTTYIPVSGQIGQVYVYAPVLITTVGPVTMQLYRDTDYSGGTEIIAGNPNLLAEKTRSGLTLTIGATGTEKGTAGPQYLIGGQSHGNQSANGSTQGLSYFITNNTKKSLVEITNSSGEEITFHYGQVFYEI